MPNYLDDYTPPDLEKPKQIGIVSVEADPLQYDPLRIDPLKSEYDPTSKDASKRVGHYYEEYGLSLMPEEAASLRAKGEAYAKQADTVKKSLNTYQSESRQAINEAEQKGKDIINTIQYTAQRPAPIASEPLMLYRGKRTEPTGKNAFMESRSNPGINTALPAFQYEIPAGVKEKLVEENIIAPFVPLYIAYRENGIWVNRPNTSKQTVYRIVQPKAMGAIERALADASNQLNQARQRQETSYQEAVKGAAAKQESERANATAELKSQKDAAVAKFEQEYGQGLSEYFQLGQQWKDFISGEVSKQNRAKAGTQQAISQMPGIVASVKSTTKQ